MRQKECIQRCFICDQVMEKTVGERWGLEAGLTTETRPAQDTFRLDDPEEFIM